MRFAAFSFGSIQIDDLSYDHDVVIDGGAIRKREKQPSKILKDAYGHTPLSAAEEIPWTCRRLVVGTGAYGRLPVTEDVRREAARRKIELLIVPTAEAHQGPSRSGGQAPRYRGSAGSSRGLLGSRG